MAKVKGALFSLEASGKFGDSLVYDKRGYVRVNNTPTNTRTAAQGNVRQTLIAAQKGVSICGPQTRKQLQEGTLLAKQVGNKYRSYLWHSYLTQTMLGTQRANFLQSITAFNALDTAGQTAWNDEATSIGLQTVNLSYADEGEIPAGAELFMLARTLYQLGLYTAPGAPDSTNAPAWKTLIIT